jgi:hypothetical protein
MRLPASLTRGSQVRSPSRPPPSLQVSNSARYTLICPAERGLFESALVSESVSRRRKVGFYPSVSASKNSVPDSDVRDRFDDWVGGWQFGPFQLHHPVQPNPSFSGRARTGRFCGDFRRCRSALSVSRGSLRSLTAILASGLCTQKFRSLQQGCGRKGPSGILGVLGPKRTFPVGPQLSRIQSEGFKLLAPFCRSITKSLDANTSWQTTFDRSAHEIWREERE